MKHCAHGVRIDGQDVACLPCKDIQIRGLREALGEIREAHTHLTGKLDVLRDEHAGTTETIEALRRDAEDKNKKLLQLGGIALENEHLRAKLDAVETIAVYDETGCGSCAAIVDLIVTAQPEEPPMSEEMKKELERGTAAWKEWYTKKVKDPKALLVEVGILGQEALYRLEALRSPNYFAFRSAHAVKASEERFEVASYINEARLKMLQEIFKEVV